MPFVGSIIPPSAIGQGPDKRVQRRKDAVRGAKFDDALSDAARSIGDEVVLSSVEETETERSVGGPSANDSEEGHEDRAQHGAYANGPPMPASMRPSIDVQG